MKHVMYTTPKLNFIHTYTGQCREEAQVRFWSEELGGYIHQTGRECAAMALKRLRKNGVQVKRKVVS